MSTQNILQVRESSTTNMIRVIHEQHGRKIVTYAKIGERHEPPKLKGQSGK